MNFLVDAQLPHHLCNLFESHGHTCVHTQSLPQGNLTTDSEIKRLSLENKWVVITKDVDFFHSFILKRSPYKLIFVKTGNMRLEELLNLFRIHISRLLKDIETYGMIELTRTGVTNILP